MTGIAEATLSRDEARSLTDEVKHDAERLWAKLLELYEGGAHIVLGYSSWGGYFKAEFGQDKNQAYRVLNSARVMRELESPKDKEHRNPVQFPIGDSRPSKLNESQARELVPLLDEPDQLREAWSEAVKRTDGTPTASAVREVVQEQHPKSIYEAITSYVSTEDGDLSLDSRFQAIIRWAREVPRFPAPAAMHVPSELASDFDAAVHTVLVYLTELHSVRQRNTA